MHQPGGCCSGVHGPVDTAMHPAGSTVSTRPRTPQQPPGLCEVMHGPACSTPAGTPLRQPPGLAEVMHGLACSRADDARQGMGRSSGTPAGEEQDECVAPDGDLSAPDAEARGEALDAEKPQELPKAASGKDFGGAGREPPTKADVATVLAGSSSSSGSSSSGHAWPPVCPVVPARPAQMPIPCSEDMPS